MEELVISIPKSGLVYLDTEESGEYAHIYIKHENPGSVLTRWESSTDSPISYMLPERLQSPVRPSPFRPSPVRQSPFQLSPVRASPERPPLTISPILPTVPVVSSQVIRSPSPMQLTPVMTGKIITSSPVVNSMNGIAQVSPVNRTLSSFNNINSCDTNSLVVNFEPSIFIEDVAPWESIFSQFGNIAHIGIKSNIEGDSLLVITNDLQSNSNIHQSLDNTIVETYAGNVLLKISY